MGPARASLGRRRHHTGANVIAPFASTSRVSLPIDGQHVEVRQRLAEGLARVLVQDAREHLLHDRERRRPLGDERRHVVEPRLMMVAQLPQPRMQVAERQAVRRQHQRVGRQRLEPRQRIQIFLHRVGVRPRRRHDHRRRDVRQHLVAGDQDLVLLAVERRMLQRMPARGDDAPLALAHARPRRRP